MGYWLKSTAKIEDYGSLDLTEYRLFHFAWGAFGCARSCYSFEDNEIVDAAEHETDAVVAGSDDLLVRKIEKKSLTGMEGP